MLTPLRATSALVLGLATAGLAVPVLDTAAQADVPTAPYISELHYDNDGADVGEFVEVTLPAGATSAGLSVVLYNGSGGGAYRTDALPTVTAPAEGARAVVIEYAGILQNGSPDGVALVGPGGVIELLAYEGPFTATNGPASGVAATDIGVFENGSQTVGLSLSRTYDAATGVLAWQPSTPATKGQVNPGSETSEPGPAPQPCHAPATHEIGEVQGAGDRTPLEGQVVTVRGTVVGDLPGLSGLHLQDPDGDGEPATSDAVFVFGDAAVDPAVDLGDTVAVTGTAKEFHGLTEVEAQSAQVCADGDRTSLPAAAALDLPAGQVEREALEAMLVESVDTLTVSEVYALTRFGQLTLSEGGRLVQPTEVARPGTPEGDAVAADNAGRRILLDDGRSAGVSVTTRPYLTPATPVRVGDRLRFTEPLVLGYAFAEWRLQPADGTADGVFAPQDTREPAPETIGGELRVSAFNVLNYFLTWAGPTARGARSEAAFLKQASKIVAAITRLDADVVSLMEIEDTASTGLTPGYADTALADLVRRLNAAEGAGTWAYVPLPRELYQVDRDVIRNAIIYKPARVAPVGRPVGLVDETVWTNAREPIAQAFLAEDDVVTVVANHFKSKSPGRPTGDNVDAGDGQGHWNGDRVRQARSLAGFADQLVADSEDPDVLLMGDFNAYTQEDPIEELRKAGYTDLGERLDPGRYSYVFNGLSGSLDHALGTPELTAKVTGVTHWNINAVESFAYQYNGDPALYAPSPYRSSDHDPLVIALDLQAPRAEAHPCDGRVPTILGTNSADTIRGTDGVDVIAALGGEDVVTALRSGDVVCAGAGDDEVDGGNGRDALFGGAGDDVLRGGNGDDRLYGGRGHDVLRQGRGTGSLVQD